MSLDTAIRDAIFDVVLSGYTLGPSEHAARCWPGKPVNASQYGNAWSPTNITGSQAATESLSRFVDSIPSLSATYAPSGRTVEDNYQQVVRFGRAKGRSENTVGATLAGATRSGAQPSSFLRNRPASLPDATASEINERSESEVRTPDGKKVRAVVLTPEAQSKRKLSRQHADQTALAQAMLALAARYPVANKAALSPKINEAKNLADAALKSLQALTPPRRPMMRAFAGPSDPAPSIDLAFNKAREMFERSALSSIVTPLLEYHASYVSPEDWTNKEAAADWPFLSIPVLADGFKLDLSLRFSRVDILRPWFLMSLFDFRDWTNGAAPGTLSTGKIDQNLGSFPLLPLSMLVVRDVKAADAAGAVRLQAPGLQILAWISKVIPYCPY